MSHYNIPRQMTKHMHHDMIEKYADLPYFPHGRTRLLRAFLEAGTSGESTDHDLFAVVTSLVQLGMDTHDQVEVEDFPEDLARTRKKQLRVLAGDFFSAKFYQLLSQEGKINIVKKLSAAICEVNRLKLNLFDKIKQVRITAEEYVQSVVEIKSELFQSFTCLMEGKYKEKWPAILQAFTRSEVLLEELERVYDRTSFKDSWGYWYLLEVAESSEVERLKNDEWAANELKLLAEKYELKSMMTSMIETQIEKLYAGIHRFRSQSLLQELQSIGERFRRFIPDSTALELY